LSRPPNKVGRAFVYMDITNLKKALTGQPAYRYKQVNLAIFGQLINSWAEATGLPKDLREKLQAECPLEIQAEVIADKRSEKAGIVLADGSIIESVLIKNSDGRNTVCVSSQVGCPLKCAFCATGQNGFRRNLTVDEIIMQVLFFARQLKLKEERVDNVVFMGMGEPFLNTENVLSAVKSLNDKEGLNIGARNISISTSGLPEGIHALTKFPLQINLAISLHAPNDNLRQTLMPIAKKYNLKSIWRALKDYLEIKNRKLMFEYIMIDGVNDSDKQAQELGELLLELPKHLLMVNLIPYNLSLDSAGSSEFKPSKAGRIETFKKILFRRGIETTIRESLGSSISGACGQLAGKRNLR